MAWSEIYEHDEFGEIRVDWHGSCPDRSSLIAIQPDIWTPASEVADCLAWAKGTSGARRGNNNMRGDEPDAPADPLPRNEGSAAAP